MSSLDAHLTDLVGSLSVELPEVTTRRMFGADAFFANRNIYCLVWDGRIVLRLTEPSLRDQALAMSGATTFDPVGNSKGMSKWVVMSEDVHDSLDDLAVWVERAHRLAMQVPPKKIKARVAAAKKKAKRSTPAKKKSRR